MKTERTPDKNIRTTTIAGRKVVLRPVSPAEARKSAAAILRRHAVAIANLKDR